ncbi:MAG: 16S rRNA (guanine(966)-N(2))-methyltransferase RsmD [Lachnospiraceae bacterium]|nr:16S rRNA (guanine(966)-N(2))-methyltransferase RsmD [Lachnospiraceae bacterium]
MRVIAGEARRLKLVAPAGNDTRPTQDIIKETLFNMIHHDLPGAVFCDLYAGSGAIGIEALSRGASYAYFVENDTRALSCLQKNLITTRMTDRAFVLRSDVPSGVSRLRAEEIDFVYMDPPYDAALYAPTLRALSSLSCITGYTTVIAESGISLDFSFANGLGFDVIKEKRYKHNKHVFLQRSEGA